MAVLGVGEVAEGSGVARDGSDRYVVCMLMSLSFLEFWFAHVGCGASAVTPTPGTLRAM